MEPFLGVGVPGWPTVGAGWNWAALVAPVGAVVIARVVLMRMTPLMAAVAAACGLSWAYASQRWGLAIPTAAALLLVALLPSVARRRGRY